MKKNLILLISFLSFTTLFAQRPGGRPPGGGPETIIAIEKQAVLDKITDLNEDQELLLDGIYDEFNITLNNISIYPNPVKGILNIKVEDVDSKNLNLFIHNSNGQLVYEKVFNNTIQIETNSWAAGLYFLRIEILSSKIIVK